jgi:hypothetical protein
MLKRAVDAGEDAPAPSEVARARVLAAARTKLQTRPQRMRRLALVATAAAMLVAAPLLWRATAPRLESGRVGGAPASDTAEPTTPLPSREAGAVDTARATPENLRFL